MAILLSACSSTGQFAQFMAPTVSDETTASISASDAPVPAMRGDDQPMPSVMSYADTGEGTKTNMRADIDKLIAYYAAKYTVPASFVHRVVNRESTYNPHARNGVHLGLMQLNPATARTMGYRGPNEGLMDPDTNLRYGVKYLAGAYLVADGNEAKADRLYQSGYYYHAKRKGLLKATGLRP